MKNLEEANLSHLREKFKNYCNSDEGFEKCDFDPNDLRVEDDLIYLA